MAKQDVRELYDVSRETYEKLEFYVKSLLTWNKRINLVSKNSEPDIWPRHILDSLQMHKFMTGVSSWVDIGSGGGLPAIPLSIILQENNPTQEHINLKLVESDKRKSAFLRYCIHELNLNAEVLPERIETCTVSNVDLVTARALAELTELLRYSKKMLHPDGIGLFPKGRNWATEIEKARREWNFDCDVNISVTDPDSAILLVKSINKHE